jgi:serine/threonine-protein kinase
MRVRLLVCALVLSASSRAGAEPAATHPDEARALFFDARQLMAEQRFAEACPKLEQSEQLDPGKGTEFNLARCYEHVGRPAAALVLYERVMAQSRQSGQTAHEELARDQAEAVARRVPRLVVDVPDAARVAGLRVAIDGVPLDAAAWSTSLRLEPGRHAVAARADGHVAWETTVALSEGESMKLPVPRLADAAPEPPPTAPPPAPVGVAGAPSAEQPAVDRGRTQRTAALVVGGAGAAGLAAGGVLVALAVAAYGDARSQGCSDTSNACPNQPAVDTRSTALARGNAATWTLAGGAALLGVGAVLWLTAPSSGAPARVGLGAGGGGPAVVVGGGV